MKKYFLILIVAIMVISFCVQCSKFEPTPIQIKACFEKNVNIPVSEKPKKLVKIYIDGSYSMNGFVRMDGNTVFGQMLERLRSMNLREYSREFYKFEEEIKRITDEDVHTAQSQRWFFGGKDTRLSDVCAQFLKPALKEQPAAYVIITDGVQSIPGEVSDYVKVSNQINQWLKSNSFQIIAMRSQFAGEFCSETKKQMKSESIKFSYSSSEGAVKTYRPFYLYIFATDTAFTKAMVSRMQPEKISPDYHLIDVSSNIYNEPDVVFMVRRSDPNGQEKNAFEKYTYNAKFPDLIVLNWKAIETGKPSLPGYLNVKLKIEPSKWMSAFVRHPENIRLESECVSLSRTGECTPVTPTPTIYLDSTTIEEENGGNLGMNLWLRFKDELPLKGRFAYHIRFLPQLRAFESASWVVEWSTNRDDEPKYASKTLYLQKFISCLLEQPSLVDQSLGEIYIGIRR